MLNKRRSSTLFIMAFLIILALFSGCANSASYSTSSEQAAYAGGEMANYGVAEPAPAPSLPAYDQGYQQAREEAEAAYPDADGAKYVRTDDLAFERKIIREQSIEQEVQDL